MGDQSAIEWTDATWNPTTGCDRISPGCDHCYALDQAAKLKVWLRKHDLYQVDGDPRTSGPGFGLQLHPTRLDIPRRWRKPRRVFVDSMSDLFHKLVPDAFIFEVFDVMAACPQHTFQVLTKRPKRMRDTVAAYYAQRPDPDEAPLANVWLGVSIESRAYAWRADLLRQTPAAVRFVSAEPLLGPLVPIARTVDGYLWESAGHELGELNDDPGLSLALIDWLIVGGESGPSCRPVDPEWVRSLRDACLAQGGHLGPELGWRTAFFFKQWGGRTPKTGGRDLGGRTWDEFPAVAA
jgi:protein gp37